jgi:hypothetical protein
MDEKLFLQRLSEVAEWHRPKVAESDPRRPKKGRRSAEEIEWEQNEQATVGEELTVGPNSTVPPIITRIKYPKESCSDCGKIVEGRCVQIRYCTSNRPHIRENCLACGFHKDPRTGEFTMNPKASQTVWAAYTRGTGKYKSKYQTIETKATEFQTIETDESIIRRFEPKNN